MASYRSIVLCLSGLSHQMLSPIQRRNSPWQCLHGLGHGTSRSLPSRWRPETDSLPPCGAEWRFSRNRPMEECLLAFLPRSDCPSARLGRGQPSGCTANSSGGNELTSPARSDSFCANQQTVKLRQNDDSIRCTGARKVIGYEGRRSENSTWRKVVYFYRKS